ncbi:MAG: response regulator [Anaerolineae bacterium]|nr:response regulator [Anaerolineae bacterium]
MTYRIVVADDEANIRLLVQQTLEEAFDEQGLELEVLHAADGAQALHLVRTQAPHLLITDVMMPEMDGFELTSRIRQDPATGKLPVIILTIVDDDGQAASAGADFQFSKPINSAQLLRGVAALLFS